MMQGDEPFLDIGACAHFFGGPKQNTDTTGSDDVVKNGHVQLSALRNHIVILYFYPKEDWTPVNIGVYVISILG